MNLCPYQHTNKLDNVWVRGDGQEVIEVVTQSNGLVTVKLRCSNCRNLSGALPKDVVWEWLDPFAPATHRGHQGEPCSVLSCSSADTEWHHFAPSNTFGDDAGDWPILPLCRVHHIEWHQRMDGYRWHRRAVAS